MDPAARAEAVRAALPENGLFADREWVIATEPFPISRAQLKRIDALGQRLLLFLKASNQIYLRSRKGKLPSWIAEYLEAGKPPELMELGASPALREAVPSVIRPDLLVTDDGFALTEIDSVPGGIGLTAWLGETYASLGGEWDIVGGKDGMLSGFGGLFDSGADIVISEESADYLPEMEWLAGKLGEGWGVQSAESYQVSKRAAYRFFELFDLPNIPAVMPLLEAAAAGEVSLTAPPKTWLEEKMLLALFWSPALKDVWVRELRGSHREELEKIIPYSWVVDPAPLPHQAVFPRTEIQDWQQLADFSQKERQLVLKLSGFSEDAWGSRSVSIGHDQSQSEWKASVETAIASFPTNPYVLQEFRGGSLHRQKFWDDDSGEERELEGRVRLCPYYFVSRDGKKTSLGGILATVTPADKKIIHGMRDAVIAPVHVVDERV